MTNVSISSLEFINTNGGTSLSSKQFKHLGKVLVSQVEEQNAKTQQRHIHSDDPHTCYSITGS